jgi:hypothetical protein
MMIRPSRTGTGRVEVVTGRIGSESLENGQMSLARRLFDGRPADEALFLTLWVSILRQAQLRIRRRRMCVGSGPGIN